MFCIAKSRVNNNILVMKSNASKSMLLIGIFFEVSPIMAVFLFVLPQYCALFEKPTISMSRAVESMDHLAWCFLLFPVLSLIGTVLLVYVKRQGLKSFRSLTWLSIVFGLLATALLGALGITSAILSCLLLFNNFRQERRRRRGVVPTAH